MYSHNRLGNMELSKEVHGLLERIKKLSQHAQRNESYSNMPINISLNLSQKNLDFPVNRNDDEITFNQEDLIPVDNMDFTDNERWLHVSENSMENPYTGNLNEWLGQDFALSQELETQFEPRKFIDTRTFTRPKKRMSRPSLEQFTDGYFSPSSSKSSLNVFSDDLSTDFNPENIGPVHFKLSEPVYNSSFDTILANASESIDSFQNMSPPSLMNSLCSSTFTTLMDSYYMNQDIVPNDKESFVENNDPNITYIADDKSINETFNIKKDDQINNTYLKTNNGNSFTNTNTYTRKPKAANLTNSFKASCPDINRTFQRTRDCNLDLTFQKLSDSQPDLTEDLKRTILNQSMELMLPSSETYHSARSGSADSLDERSSSISNSSKDSGTKILNMGDLDTLAKVQEQKLQQAMSTPKQSKTRLLLLEGEVLSPIQNCDDEYLSDSDLSDSCLTARSRFSKHNSPVRAVPALKSERPEVNFARSLNSKPEVGLPLRPLPTMIVKPMEINRKIIEQSRPHTAQIPVINRPKIRASGLPRPTLATSIPRPTSRIPAPRSIRPPSSRPNQRQPPKSDWMDGCY